MKVICIIALVLGIASIGIGIYHLTETYPNMKSYDAMFLKSNSPLDRDLYLSTRKAGWMQIYTMWGVGGLGLILGAIGTIKEKEKMRYLALAGGVLSIAALVISMTTMMAGRVG